MQILKEEVREEIKNAAIEVFLEKGFGKASMQSIAGKANVSVSNIYNYFESKEKLFYAIVDPVYRQIDQIIQGFMEDETGQSFTDGDFIKRFIRTVAKGIGTFFEGNRRQLLLIFDKSQGTKYEQAKEKLIAFLEEHFTNSSKDKPVNESTSFIMHIGATNMVEGLLEIVRHYRSDAWVENSVNDLIKYHVHGLAQFVD